MKQLHKDLPRKPFPVPSGVVSKGICNHTGKIAGEFCSEKTYCLYTAGYAPTEVCDGNHFEVKTKSADDGNHFEVKTKSADDATLFSNKGASAAPKPSSSGNGPAKKNTRKMF